MDARLIVVTGKTTKRVVQLRLPAVLGRSREADITVAHPMISRKHCELYEQDGLLMLRDLSSLNGTLIGGRCIDLAPLLPEGEFAIGPIVFRVRYDFNGDLSDLPETEYSEADQDLEMPEIIEDVEVIDVETDEGIAPQHFDAELEVDDAELEMPEFLSWGDAANESSPVAAPPPLPERTLPPNSSRTPAPQAIPQPARPSVNPAAARAINSEPMPRDKLPTVPLPEPRPQPKTSSKEDGLSAISPQEQSHAHHEADDEEFGSFLEGLQ